MTRWNNRPRKSARNDFSNCFFKRLTLGSALAVICFVSSGIGIATADETLPRAAQASANSTSSNASQARQPGERRVVSIEGTEVAFRWIPPGRFRMGAEGNDASDDEKPAHDVIISRGFWLAETETTYKLWHAVKRTKPNEAAVALLSAFFGSSLKSPETYNEFPVATISWDDAKAFARQLNSELSGSLLGGEFRLPTEAEWEYACRAGTTGNFNVNGRILNDLGWFKDNSDKKDHPVGQKLPNAWGLYDMHGNVSEWCSDWYGAYPNGTSTDPVGPDAGDKRVLRSAAYSDVAWGCRSSCRGYCEPDKSLISDVGFRLVLTDGVYGSQGALSANGDVFLQRVDRNASNAQPSNVKLSNGNYHPGAVLVYRNGSLEVATPSNVDRAKTSYVLIHGAHRDSTFANMTKLATTIAKKRPNANVLLVDWRYLSRLKIEDFMDGSDLLGINARFNVTISKLGGKMIESQLREDYNAKVDLSTESDVLAKLANQNISFNLKVLTIRRTLDQLQCAAMVSERVYMILFEKSGANVKFSTNGAEGAFVSLGLNPRDTHMIGHSIGANIAGIAARKCHSNLGARPKRLTALDPWNSEIECSAGNFFGVCWDHDAADFVDVYRKSEVLCGDKIYGDFNLHVRNKKHPLFSEDVDSQGYDISKLAPTMKNIFAVDAQMHEEAIALFIEIVEDDSLKWFNLKATPRGFESDKWNIVGSN